MLTMGAASESNPQPHLNGASFGAQQTESTYFQEPLAESKNLDQKIDDAIAIAERLSTDNSDVDSLDDIEIPSFLRHGMADLPSE